MIGVDIPLTKFRIPRPRGAVVARNALVARMRTAVLAHPLTVLVAPAGYGKTSVLAQLAGSLGGAPVAWVSLDPDDDDPGQLFTSLLRALQPFGLRFESEQAALVAGAAGAGSQSRAAIGMLVNALGTVPVPRLVIVLDDAHRLTHDAISSLLEALVERLPDNVSLVLSGRSLPALPLARWAVRGEAAQFGPDELGFDAAEAETLAGALAGGLADAADAAEVGRLRERTGGWPAGLVMLLRAPRDRRAAAPAEADARLFGFLAAEVLAELPAELQRFVEDSAVLADLAPSTCAAVAACPAAASQLQVLQERDVFVAVLDPVLPVLRYHDLFREFLLARLAREPARLHELHRRAAGVETAGSRVVGHWLAADEPASALERLLRDADTLLAEGGHHAIERWLDRFPAEFVEHAAGWHYLAGICAWRRWHWPRAGGALRRAAALLDGGKDAPLRPRVLQYLMGAERMLGNSDAAATTAGILRQLPLDPPDRTGVELQLAWCKMSDGHAGAVVQHLREAVRLVEADPATIAPQIADRAHALYMGVSGALPVYRALLDACKGVSRGALAPWQGAPALIEGWVRLWEGELAEAEAALERARDIDRRFGGMPPLRDGCERLEATLLWTTGRGAQALEITGRRMAAILAQPPDQLRIAYANAYLHGHARTAWGCGDREAFRVIAPRAAQPRLPGEWATIGISSRLIPAQLALLAGDWAAAAAGFEDVIEAQGENLFPLGHADPRLGLAHARLRLGDRVAAQAALDPVLDQCVRERAIGWLLLEPDWLVAPLLEALHPERRGDIQLRPLLARLAGWRAVATARAARPVAQSRGPLDDLSERELEVLERVAEGAGNKEIAREFGLSVHTVKRHIANILGKLDCVSRRQAALLFKRERAGN